VRDRRSPAKHDKPSLLAVLAGRAGGQSSHHFVTATWSLNADAAAVHPSASPQLVRLAVIVEWPVTRAVYVAIALPHPPPGTQDGAGRTCGEPTGLSTAGLVGGWYCQYVLARSTRTRWPTWIEITFPLSASVAFTTPAVAVADELGVDEELRTGGKDRCAAFVVLLVAAVWGELVQDTSVHANIDATSITAEVFNTYSP
jgi:hypothetical protein